MATFNYKLNSRGDTSYIFVRVKDRSQNIDALVNTKLNKVSKKEWDEKKQRMSDLKISASIKDEEAFNSERDRRKTINTHLDNLYSSLENGYLKYSPFDKQAIERVISDYWDDKKEVATEKTVPKTVAEFIKYRIARMSSGIEKTKDGDSMSKQTVKAWGNFRKLWDEFEGSLGLSNPLVFEVVKNKQNQIINDCITKDVLSQFIDFCKYEKGYQESTKRKYITTLKAVMNYAIEEEVSNNLFHKSKSFSKAERPTGTKKPYLTENELDKLFNLVLTNERDMRVRDMFLIGCYCGQRVSDYSRFSSKDITILDDGTKCFDFVQKKTSNPCLVPFLSDNIERIFQRWGGELPSVRDYEINDIDTGIKNLCKMAKINEPVKLNRWVYEVGEADRIETTTESKYSLISSHTARRSCITNLYASGKLNIKELMSVSGHKSMSAFEGYICLSSEDIAKSIAKKMGTDKK